MIIVVTNPLARANGETKRCTDVIGMVRNEEAIIRRVGTFLLKQNDAPRP